MAQTINTRIVLRNDTTANWAAHSDQVLLKGEVGLEFMPDGKVKMKIGDGITSWANLEYSNSGFDPANGALIETITQEMVNQWSAAQPNTIEKIFVNNAEVSIVDKRVDIAIPTQASDIGAATADHNHDGIYLKANEPIPAALLPGYVDDVIEVATVGDLPETGESGKIYVVVDENTTYRWTGTQYVKMSCGVVLGETAETAFRGDLGKVAYDHAMSEHAPVNAQENVIEIFKMAGEIMPVKEKSVEIPVASTTGYGVVKSSSGANQVTVAADGTMKVGVISTSSLKVPIGETLVLNGGAADGSDPVYPTRINNIGYDTLSEAVSAANDGDVVTLMSNVQADTPIVASASMTLDLAESSIANVADLWNDNSDSWSLISVSSGGNLTIDGDGIVDAKENDCYAVDIRNGGTCTINSGTFNGNVSSVYVSSGHLIINGGTFAIKQLADSVSDDKYRYTLNCLDANYANGTASITVKGGRFYKFDPANNASEGPGTNYVADGYKSVKDGDYYVVKPV